MQQQYGQGGSPETMAHHHGQPPPQFAYYPNMQMMHQQQQQPAGFGPPPPQAQRTNGEDREAAPKFRLDGKEPTLELLQSRFNTPLVDVAREFRVSLTMMKRLCRKLGIQRWPHRQIRSLDKLLFELEERISATTSARELSYLQEQVALLEKKRRLVTRGASSGLQSALRNALFMADPSTLLEEEELFDEDKLNQLDDALSKLPPSEQRKIMHKGESNPVLKIMTSANAKPPLKRKRIKTNMKVEKATRALKEVEEAALERNGQAKAPTLPMGEQGQGGWEGSQGGGAMQQQQVPHGMQQQMPPMPPHMGMWGWGYGDMAAQAAAAAHAAAGGDPTGGGGGGGGGMGMDMRPDMNYMYGPMGAYHGDPNAAAAAVAMMQQHPHMHQMMGMGMPGPHMFAAPTTIPYMQSAPVEGTDYPAHFGQAPLMAGMPMYRGDGGGGGSPQHQQLPPGMAQGGMGSPDFQASFMQQHHAQMAAMMQMQHAAAQQQQQMPQGMQQLPSLSAAHLMAQQQQQWGAMGGGGNGFEHTNGMGNAGGDARSNSGGDGGSSDAQFRGDGGQESEGGGGGGAHHQQQQLSPDGSNDAAAALREDVSDGGGGGGGDRSARNNSDQGSNGGMPADSGAAAAEWAAAMQQHHQQGGGGGYALPRPRQDGGGGYTLPPPRQEGGGGMWSTNEDVERAGSVMTAMANGMYLGAEQQRDRLPSPLADPS